MQETHRTLLTELGVPLAGPAQGTLGLAMSLDGRDQLRFGRQQRLLEGCLGLLGSLRRVAPLPDLLHQHGVRQALQFVTGRWG